jgi:hypothetical protein
MTVDKMKFDRMTFSFFYQIKSGDVVATVYLDDKKWYRAKVVEVINDDYDESQTQVRILSGFAPSSIYTGDRAVAYCRDRWRIVLKYGKSFIESKALE